MALEEKTPDAAAVSLTDRYVRREGRVLISGVQALVRLMLVQADRDAAAGRNTGGFVSGYRGSPLGTVDTTFASARSLTEPRGIKVMPAVNEELAATAVAGTQHMLMTGRARVDGVFALWYGKGPGLDRAADAIRHGNLQGSSPAGGVLLAVGDDHTAKSSTLVVSSDETVASLAVPLFYPADAREVVEFGLHGFALSRHSGAWAALKIVTDVADASRVVATDELARDPILPPQPDVPGGLHFRWPDTPAEQEARHHNHRLPAVLDYVRANGLDRALHRTPASRIGIVAAGKPWLDLIDALHLLGIEEGQLPALGIALYKPALIWPLEPASLRDFALGLDRLIFVEEKSGLIEAQAKAQLYGQDGAPHILGKCDADGNPLFPATGELTPESIAALLAKLLPLPAGSQEAGALLADQASFAAPVALRRPFFCSGCPHNRSTVLPQGSRALSGIGCHGMASMLRPNHSGFCQMGGEGVHWVGLAPFTDEPHVFANMGDGTYFHSGILAIRQAVAAGVNLTYKLLYNSAVAMTGGQPVDGELSVEQMIEQVAAEGVAGIVLATDDPGRYPKGHPARARVEKVVHRDDIEALQVELRDRTGVTVILYEQMCATEKRRLRKRGKLAEPPQRVFINARVCEGCGDCSVKSNCLSVEPLPTPDGVKRRINQSSCNKDMSCLNGFCPSFVTVEGGAPRKAGGADPADLPAPPAPVPLTADPVQRILAGGIGGTGVVTIGALLVMAAHMRGLNAGVLDQVGLSQKGGAVTSHINFGSGNIAALRIPPRQAGLIIACDQIVGNARDVMAAIDPGRTFVVANADTAVTGDFTSDRSAIVDATLLHRRLMARAGQDNFAAHPFTRLAERLLGDAIGANLMMLGYAWQRGWLDMDGDAFDAAIRLNGVGVGMNRAALLWGRLLAIDPAPVLRSAGLGEAQEETAEALIARHIADLTQYQNASYAARYGAAIDRIRRAEAALNGGTALTEAAARSLYKLMAYKDEYEVARLYTDGAFAKALAEQFDGDVRLQFHLAPPLIAKRDPLTGHLRKRRFGKGTMPLFRLLARMRFLRGTAFDIFGFTHERREERALATEFLHIVETLASGLTAANSDAALAIARLPMEVRGYGHVKEQALARYRADMAAHLSRFAAPGLPVAA
ncbi:indolepyruvate ferredoxin oxidoreductase family protein [Sphingobium sp. DC-2]|uniref:indolepyruvate ferredoxin oxidoreductase family protein n=1 Tax=Sphingobium sp. DC-2 TaxID=1303256 RepID=UPI0004C4105A|nr:indolepyruvate ferredoxin oxidoreductase family protein [Sphingobium sp. DC-2]